MAELCRAFRAYVEPGCGYPVAYPDPGPIQTNTPVGVVNPVSASLVYRGGSEQEWIDALRLDVVCSAAGVTPQVLASLHALPEVFADLFSADDPDKYTLGGLTDRCALVGYEYGTLDRNGSEYAVGRFTFDVKRHRFAGDD